MENIVANKLNEVYFVLNCDIGICMELKSYFSCFVPNYKFHPKFKARIWNGKISFFDSINRTLPIGLLNNLEVFCEKYEYNLVCNFDKRELKDNISLDLVSKFSHALTQEMGMKPHDEQIDAIHSALNNKRGIIVSPTGSGKSNIIYNVIRYLLVRNEKRYILLIVPSISLVEQLYSDFKNDYGWTDISDYVTKLHSGLTPDFNKNVLCTTWQSIYNKPQTFFEKYDTLIIDETHGVKSLSLKGISQKCINAKYRIGLTGTMPTDTSERLTIHGYLGDTIYDLKSKELIDKGILSKITIVNMFLKYPKEFIDKNKRRPYQQEIEEVIAYDDRNKVLSYIFDLRKEEQNYLILCSKIDHLNILKDYVTTNFDKKFKIYIIHGEISAKDRETIRKSMELESNIILIGTYGCLSTGVNIRQLHNVIFASGYKSKIKVLQSVGRGLRKHKNKSKVIIWDLVDDMTFETRNGNIHQNYSYIHWSERSKYYEEQGFKTINKSFVL